MNRSFSRRTILRGAGVALSLPWLESLAPRVARAQDVVRKRYIPIYLPNGASENWQPTRAGMGAAWELSGPLQPLEAFKAKMTVLTGLENGSSFNANGSTSVEPSHGRQGGAWLTSIDPGVVRQQLGVAEANRISIDQTIAKDPKANGGTPIKSLQVGLSTTNSNCDGHPCSNSRTISWNEMGRPMYKSVDPLEVFGQLAGVTKPITPTTPTGPDPAVQKRIALNKSVLDAVIENATRTHTRLGTGDRAKLDEFLTHVRAVEKKATTMSTGMGGLACMPLAKPTFGPVLPASARSNTATYNKGTHADVMNDLIAMAFQCDATRIISYMLEDERSEFTYNHVMKRTFTATGSTQATGTCGEYHNNGQHGPQADFAAITWWNASKVAELCKKLDAVKEGDKTILDNTVIMFGAAMHGSNHSCGMLPMTLIGRGGGRLKTDQHVVFPKRWLRDVHVTVMKEVFGMSGPGVDDFGIQRADNPAAVIREILAT